MDILLQTIILEFSKTKNLTKKRPPKVLKIKNIYKEASIKKFYKTDPPKVGIMI